jgi:diacylglycerol kinase (ATP)
VQKEKLYDYEYSVSNKHLILRKAQLKSLDLVFGGLQARLMRWKALRGARPNMNHIVDNIWIGGANSPTLIVNEGFNAVLDLRTEDSQAYRGFLEEHGVEYLNVKTPDQQGISPGALFKITEWLSQKNIKGDKILVHCNLGRGRAALAVAAYMIQEGASPQEAIRKIKEKRNVTYLNDQQLQSLSKFSKSHSPIHS